MARHVLLNNIDHQDIRVDTGHGAALGDEIMFAPTFPAEFRNLQACYPIVFGKDAQGRFQPLALFGLREGENLFLEGNRWKATCLPLAVERRPFLIGRDGGQLMVHIDLDDPRVGTDRGEPLFREHGGTTDFLDRIRSLLLSLHDGLQQVPAFVDALVRLELLEPFVLDVQLDRDVTTRLAGYHVVNEERLGSLDDGDIVQLHRDRFLEPLYMAVASLSHFRDLIERLKRRGSDCH